MSNTTYNVALRVRFTYNGKNREGMVEKVGTSANGGYITVQLGENEFKSFSLNKIENYQVVG